MGAEQSNAAQARAKYDSDKYSKEHVDLLLERQKQMFEEKLKAAKASQDSARMAAAAAAAQTQVAAREEARKEVERIMRLKQEESMTNRSPPSTSDMSLERDRMPYSFSKNDLHIGVATPTATNLYPNLSAATTSSQASSSAHFMGTNPFQTQSPTASFPSTAAFNHNRPSPSAPADRDRSLSRSRNWTRKPNNEDKELNCPTCNKTFGVNIFNCQRGHSSCSNCKENTRPCGICSSMITTIRNITLESYVSERRVPCPNSIEGCCLYVRLADVNQHLKECPFREMPCPLLAIFGQCPWRGKLQQLSGHFDDVHQMHRQGNVDTEMFLFNISHDNKIVHYVTIGPFNFLFHIVVSTGDGKIYMTVQLIGTTHSAEKWSYEIHVFNKKQPRRKYQYADTCSSNTTPLNVICGEEKCAVLPMAYAKTFVNEECLTYKFYIKRDEESRSQFSRNRRGRGAGPRR